VNPIDLPCHLWDQLEVPADAGFLAAGARDQEGDGDQSTPTLPGPRTVDHRAPGMRSFDWIRRARWGLLHRHHGSGNGTLRGVLTSVQPMAMPPDVTLAMWLHGAAEVHRSG
jgi:hypothetical protein